MEKLKEEVERKRKAVELAKHSKDVGRIEFRVGDERSDSTTTTRAYLKTADLKRFQERQREEEELRRQLSSTENSNIKRRRDDENSTTTREATVRVTADIARERDVNTGSSSLKQEEKMKEERLESKMNSSGTLDSQHHLKRASKNRSPEETTNTLRELGLPVRLFGERTIPLTGFSGKFDDSQRLERLQEACDYLKTAMAGLSEMDEFRLGSGHGIRNPFLGGKKSIQRGEDHDDALAAVAAKNKAIIASGSKLSNRDVDTLADSIDKEKEGAAAFHTEEEKDDPHKRIHRFFKSLLRQWEDDLALRSDVVKRTAAGKNETKTLKQCKDYIRPLFKQCKTRRLDPNMMNHILKIVDFCQEGEFVRAHDSYMDVAIGRAAWPIGVTMVGIHARSGRAKIESSNVAHVMNSELQRKYLTSVKRLMSYYQKKRPDVPPSKKVLNM